MIFRNRCVDSLSRGSDGSAAGGRESDLSDVRPQAPCKRATARRAALGESLWPRSADDAAAPSARKLPGTATGHKGSNCRKTPEGLCLPGWGYLLVSADFEN